MGQYFFLNPSQVCNLPWFIMLSATPSPRLHFYHIYMIICFILEHIKPVYHANVLDRLLDYGI